MQYTIYTTEDAAQEAQAHGEHVLVVRPCVICGDELLGDLDIARSAAVCAANQHNSRPGVHYQDGHTIDL